MKKIIAIILAIVMMASMSVVAFAVSYNDETSVTVGGAELTYSSAQGYVITIPGNQTFTLDAEEGSATKGQYIAGGTVSTSDVKIALDKQLNVFVSSASGDCTIQQTDFEDKEAWTLVDKNLVSSPVPYTATYGAGKTTISSAAILVTTMTAGVLTPASNSVELNFTTAGSAQTGVYVDLLTFTATVTDIA